MADSRFRILAIRVGALGDTLMVTPLLRALHRRHPDAEIDFLASSLAAPLLELNPNLTNLFFLRNRNWPMAMSPEKWRLIRRLRARRYDLALLLESSSRYRRLIERVHAHEILSYQEAPFDACQHAIINNLRVAGIQADAAEDLNMDLPLSDDDLAQAECLLADLPKPRIGVHMGWGPLGRKRRQGARLRGWGYARFVQLISGMLERRGGSIWLTGSPQDEKATQAVIRSIASPRLRSIAGKTRVRELAAVIKRLDLFVSVDTGPSHMAAAVGTPSIVLWGPGKYEQTRPVSTVAPICILRHPVPCAPCQSTPMQKTCRRNICMEAITPEEVLEAAAKLLQVPHSQFTVLS